MSESGEIQAARKRNLVLEFLKVTLFICLFFQFFSTAQAADTAFNWRDYTPTQEHILKAEDWILAHSSREVRIFLYSNIPSLFPVNFICQLRDGTVKQALLPGDIFQTQSELAELDCKGLLKLSLRKGSSGTITDEDSEPKISLATGEADLQPQGKKVKIHLPDFDLRITGSDPSTRFIILQKNSQSLIFCNRGLAEGQLLVPAGENAKQKYLGAYNCRLILTDGLSTKKHYVFSDELFHPVDLGVTNNERNRFQEIEKNFPTETLIPKNEDYTHIYTNLPSSQHNYLLLHLNRLRAVPANCSLYTQTSWESPLAAAYQFKLAGESNSAIKLHPDYRKYYLSVVCSQSDGLNVSNQLNPQ